MNRYSCLSYWDTTTARTDIVQRKRGKTLEDEARRRVL